uniref:Uncharacterized protein n=1 Tax=Aegilops tauschii subsp. strangulata TaxID=200361 RepID=A0A453GQR6_AEGTS
KRIINKLLQFIFNTQQNTNIIVNCKLEHGLTVTSIQSLCQDHTSSLLLVHMS